MSTQPFVGEIKLFAGNFAIVSHAMCNGQLVAISSNTPLFSLIGTTYGGDGVTTFGLPDLRGRFPICQGQGSGLTNRVIGSNGGQETHTLIVNEIPAHNHSVACNSGTGNTTNPSNNYWAAQPALLQYSASMVASQTMKPNAIGSAGGSQPHDNMDPYLTITYLIALEGIFPSRN